MCQRIVHWFDSRCLIAAASCVLIASCAEMQSKGPNSSASMQDVGEAPINATQTMPIPDIETEIFDRADADRVQALEREVERLKMDLVRAEDALTLSDYSRANAVSSLAEAQMQLNRAAEVAPWRLETIKQARDKLETAQKHIDSEYFGAAAFFVYRANRIVEELNYEASIVDKTSQVMFVNRPRVNLRAGPSTDANILTILVRGTPVVREKKKDEWMLVRTLTGIAGWVHYSLVTSKERYRA